MSIDKLLKPTDKGQLKAPFSSLIFCTVALVGYIFVIEFLFHHSKVSFLQGLGFFSEISLLLRCSVLVISAASLFLILGSYLVWWLNRRKFNRSAILLSLFVYPLPFVIFALCNYFYIDRWTYSLFEYNMVDRATFVNILLFLFFIGVGFVLYFVNARQIFAFARKYKKIIVPLFLLLVGSGGGLILRGYSKRIHIRYTPVSQENKATLPNIIILSYDMFETTHTPLLGYHRNTTPNLLKRKDEFFIFSNHVAIATESRSGTVGLFTGCSPATTKVLSHPDRLQGIHVYEHLPAQLKAPGYHNANFGHDAYTNPSYYNMLNGFSEINGKQMAASSLAGKIKEKIQSMFLLESLVMKDIIEEYRLSIEYTFGISDALAKRKDIALVSYENKQFPDVYERIETLLQDKIPFMIHYHSNITHLPVFVRKYKVFSKLSDAISKESIEMRRKYKTCDGEKITKEDFVDLYDDTFLQMDEEVEAVIQLLERYGCYDDTLLILTTDHEYLWGSSGHPVALMMKAPGFPKGRIISERTWMLDIAPTVFDLLGILIPEWTEGQSLLPLIKGEKSAQSDRFIHIIRAQHSRLESVTVLKGDHKLVQSSDIEVLPEFFDISKGFREFEQKIKLSEIYEEPFWQLEVEAKRLVGKTLREKGLDKERELDKEKLEKWFVNDSLLKNGSFEKWSNDLLKNPDFFRGGDQVSREEKEVKVGQYSAKVSGDNFNFLQELANFDDYKGKSLTCFALMKSNVPDKYRIQIYDGINSSFSHRHLGRGAWQLLQANHNVHPSAKFLKIRIIQAAKTGNVDDVVYVDGALLVEGDWDTFYHYKLYKNKSKNVHF